MTAVAYGSGMRRWQAVVGIVLAVGAAWAGLVEDRGPVTRHTLWKVGGGNVPVYLLGSIHVMRHQNYPLERPIEEAFDQAKVVAFELDLDEARRQIAQPRTVSATEPAPASKPRSLKSQLTPATYQSLVRYLEGLGYPGSVFDQMSAPFVAGAVVQMEIRQLGFEPEWGIDAYFYRRARKYQKTVVPLETPDEQLEALNNLSDQGSDAIVAAALQDIGGLRTSLRDLIRAWKGGEVDRLADLVNGSFRDRPEVYQRVLVERNERWVPKIEELAAGDYPALVVVGTGHLVGPDSVVAMLQTKGLVVEQQ
jgi:uncharacterized protein